MVQLSMFTEVYVSGGASELSSEDVHLLKQTLQGFRYILELFGFDPELLQVGYKNWAFDFRSAPEDEIHPRFSRECTHFHCWDIDVEIQVENLSKAYRMSALMEQLHASLQYCMPKDNVEVSNLDLRLDGTPLLPSI
ncbi:hypothetical protein QYZ87_10865 [Porphyromonadaceae bacterium W3.11]|nr:hypothetical protein [Porphyromonadaceae bacterium W3.11]MDN4753901.1 hypothetical protein [Porphyromonadaceae bacterium W3.11]MDN4755007.1 hypothetical protein [Porphyromonadaceae bacterium W3.11]